MYQRLAVQHKQETLVVPIEDILWMESRDSLTFVQTQQGPIYRTDKTLDELESRLDGFFRLHRSYLVAVQAIT